MHVTLKLSLIHPELEACHALTHRFRGLPDVTVLQVSLEQMPPHDCFVTAGNSFGIMTAGIDAAVVRRFGTTIMERVQHRVMDEFLGEQPVGTGFIIPTDEPAVPFLCHAPTMRVPGSIAETDKVYAATWGAFLAIHRHNMTGERKIESVAFPAFGTGFGGMSFSESAR